MRSLRRPTRQLRAWRAASMLVMGVVLGPATIAGADHPSAPPAVWAADRFAGSERGFLGCVQVDGSAIKYCFVAHAIAGGPDGGATRVLTQLFAPPAPNTGPSFSEPEVVEDIVGADALTVLAPLPGQSVPRLRISAYLSSIGPIDIVIRTIGDSQVSQRGNEPCATHPLLFELAAEESPDVVGYVWGITGEVGGRAASAWHSGCSAYFLGPTTGAWVMPTGTV